MSTSPTDGSRTKATEHRLVLHAPLTNFYWVIIAFFVTALVALPEALVQMWRENPSAEVLVFGALGSTMALLTIAYCQKKARWVVADERGLTITERTRERLVPWSDVRLTDLGLLGASPGARRYYVELADGDVFTFLADVYAMERLDALRAEWSNRA